MNATDQEFGIEVFRFRLDVFTSQLVELVSNVSDKTIHETRVESRRMREALNSFRDMFPPFPYRSAYKSVRRITHILGEPRETAVISGLVEGLARDQTAERACVEYLHRRLSSRLRKQKARLEKKLRHIDPLRIRCQFDFLLSIMESSAGNGISPGSSRSHLAGASQPALFQMRETALSRSCRILDGLIELIAKYRPARQFDAAEDEDLHSLRIAAKRTRYAMEIFSPVWPGGIARHIESARKLQEAGGAYNDWSALRSCLDSEIKRLEGSTRSRRLVFETGRLAEYAELRKSELKTVMQTALIDLMKNLAALQRTGRLLCANPNLSPTDTILAGLRVKAPSKLKRAIGGSQPGSA
jgi:CHAD domain-containing protein